MPYVLRVLTRVAQRRLSIPSTVTAQLTNSSTPEQTNKFFFKILSIDEKESIQAGVIPNSMLVATKRREQDNNPRDCWARRGRKDRGEF